MQAKASQDYLTKFDFEEFSQLDWFSFREKKICYFEKKVGEKKVYLGERSMFVFILI